MLYPLKFNPIFKERIWGGDKLLTEFGKDSSPLTKVGESWEISSLEDNISVVSNGFLAGNNINELVEIYMGDLVGDTVYEEFGNTFPLLIKFLDAREDLSIQVHPNDELAVQRHNCYGKTELWYVIDAEPNAKLVSGFSKKIDRQSYLSHLENNTLHETLNWQNVKKGDVFFIPAGQVHAIGKGILILEIQQTSDITYRIFDYNRVDDNGNKRQLHTEQALEAIDFECVEDTKTLFKNKKNSLNKIIHCDFFSTNFIHFDKEIERDYYAIDSFVIYVCISGSFTVHFNDGTETVEKGETVLIPAELNEIKLVPNGSTEIMEIYILRQQDTVED
jgi:mannose-6-phosphate isomerase